jgi:protein-ribulosamine 3-kinase
MFLPSSPSTFASLLSLCPNKLCFHYQLASSDDGLEMVKGEFESMRALHNVSPDFLPCPFGYGTYVVDFCERLADLHRRSMAASPEGLFGFHVTTYNGRLPQDNTWNESWEAFYINGFQHMFTLGESVHDPSQEINNLLPALYRRSFHVC